MSWAIKTAKGRILHKSNNEYLFDTLADAIKYIDEHCGSSQYLKPIKLTKFSKRNKGFIDEKNKPNLPIE